MTKATEAITLLGGSFLVWVLVLFNILPLPISETIKEKVWPTLPFVALVSFGSYSLIDIGYNLVTFRECPEAYNELVGEIDEAIKELRAKNVTVD